MVVMAVGRKFVFIVNPGSASRKYAIFSGLNQIAMVHFELIDNLVVANLSHFDNKYVIKYNDGNLANVPHRILPLLIRYGVMTRNDEVSAIGIRTVAPSKQFTKDVLITLKIEKELEQLKNDAPLHTTTLVTEVKRLKTRFPKTPIIAVSDSKFHISKPEYAKKYPISLKLAERYGIERYGYHGLSVRSVVRQLSKADMLMSKLIVCHLGSGNSVTALLNGKSIENTMGFSPSEGLMMATRSGSIDISAALNIKEKLDLTDLKLEQYLNHQAGLLGVSGSSDDIRQLLTKEESGDERAKLALDMYAYKVQQAIGQMAASLNGASCLVFTATVGERSFPMRERIVQKLGYLGFGIDKHLNDKTYEPKEITNIAAHDSKPILVVSTDESTEIARRVELYLRRKTD